jgi:ATP-dependent exoDNAse (exonuclease V) alpha subunit
MMSDSDITLSPDQLRAVDAALAGRNLFLSGPGGTGKSFTVGHIIRSLYSIGKDSRITASTGIAAINVRGATIHSTLGSQICGSIKQAEALIKRNPGQLSVGWKKLHGVDCLIVDEVSMLSGDYIEMMDWWLRKVKAEEDLPFGGLQMIFVGDFLQLPPVEKEIRHEYKFAFQAPAWHAADLEVIDLRYSFRQEDQRFVDALNGIRYGTVSGDALEIFKPCVRRPLVHPTHLVTTNAKAHRINSEEMRKLDSPPRTYTATFTGDPFNVDKLKNNCIALPELTLKRGAPVIMLVNNPEQGYVNGTRGVVTGLREDVVTVHIGHTIEVERARWEWEDGSGRTVATMRQFPVRPAWALTVHKSQGMTLDCVRIDLSRIFAPGQAYVALSRLKTIEGLSLDQELDETMVFAHDAIVKFYQEMGGQI